VIRCRDCPYCDILQLSSMCLYYCHKQMQQVGMKNIKTFWRKKPAGHPRWCPRWAKKDDLEKVKRVKERLGIL